MYLFIVSIYYIEVHKGYIRGTHEVQSLLYRGTHGVHMRYIRGTFIRENKKYKMLFFSKIINPYYIEVHMGYT